MRVSPPIAAALAALAFAAVAPSAGADNAGAARTWCGNSAAHTALDTAEASADAAFDATGRTSQAERLLALQARRRALLGATKSALLKQSASNAKGGAARRAALASLRSYESMTRAYEAGIHAFLRLDSALGPRHYRRGNALNTAGLRSARVAARLFREAGVRAPTCAPPCESLKSPRLLNAPVSRAAACRRPAPA